MKSWHESNKNRTPIDPAKLSGPEGPSVHIDTSVGDISTRLESALDDMGGEMAIQANALTDSWVTSGKAFSPQAMHISAVKIARVVSEHLIEKEAPAPALVVLALAFRQAANRLISRAKEVDPKLAEELSGMGLDK